MRFGLGLCAVVMLAASVHSYYPLNCNDEHASGDFAEAEVFATGRVIGFERFAETIEYESKGQKKSEVAFGYFARVKLGAVHKGTLKVGDEILIFEGGYNQNTEDNTSPEWVSQCMTHSQAGFEIGNAYIFAANRTQEAKALNKPRYSLRSCHFSLYPLRTIIDEKTDKRRTMVLTNRDETKPVYLTVDEFLKRAERKAMDALKK